MTPGPQDRDGPATWRDWHEAMAVVARPTHLRRTSLTALVVGTVLFAINQLNVVVAGHASTVVWLKTGLTYLVPFAVSNVGILIATRAGSERRRRRRRRG